MATWFSDDEVKGLKPELVSLLDYARQIAGVPFTITSGLRTVDQNSAAGGVSDSAHLTGEAVDLRALDSTTRFKIVSALLKVGFQRIVVYAADGHIHADISKTLPSPVFVVKP